MPHFQPPDSIASEKPFTIVAARVGRSRKSKPRTHSNCRRHMQPTRSRESSAVANRAALRSAMQREGSSRQRLRMSRPPQPSQGNRQYSPRTVGCNRCHQRNSYTRSCSNRCSPNKCTWQFIVHALNVEMNCSPNSILCWHSAILIRTLNAKARQGSQKGFG